MRTTLSSQVHRSRGFTIIELLVAVVVVAILAAVALPSFLDSIRKGRRSEAFAAMSTLQQAQERLRSNRQEYTETLADLGVSGTTAPGGYYTIQIENGSGSDTGYTATASAVSGTSQVNDGSCAILSVKVDRGNLSYASCTGCTVASLTYAANDPCWKR